MIFISNFAANIDYLPVVARMTFPVGSGPPGSGTPTTLESVLDPIDDNRVEGNENVQLSAIISSGSGQFTPGGDTATVVIQDDDRELNFLE